MKKEKDINLELLRVMSCLMVIFIHVANCYSRAMEDISSSDYVFATIINGVCRVSVPLFFMISGSLLIGRPVDLQKNKERVFHIAKPLIVWSAVYLAWNAFYMEKEAYNFKNLFDEPIKRHLWYLYVLVGIYVTLPFWQKLFQDMGDRLVLYYTVLYAVLLAINYVLALLNMEVRYEIPLVGGACYLGYFVMGYIIRKYRFRLKVRRLLAAAIAIVSLGFVIGVTLSYSFHAGRHYEGFYEYRNVLIGVAALAIFYIAMNSKPVHLTDTVWSWVEVISKQSFTIYLAHILFLDILKKEIQMLGFSAFIGVPLFANMVFVATFVYAGLQERLKLKLGWK